MTMDMYEYVSLSWLAGIPFDEIAKEMTPFDAEMAREVYIDLYEQEEMATDLLLLSLGKL